MKIEKSIKALLDASANDVSCIADELKLDFAMSLEQQRRATGVSYKRLADALKTSAAYISKVFRGDSNLTIESMAKLAHAAGGRVAIQIVSSAAGSQQAAPNLECEAQAAKTSLQANDRWKALLFSTQSGSAIAIQVSSTVTAANSDAVTARSERDRSAERWAEVA